MLVPICKQQDELDSVFVLNETGSSIWSLMDCVRTSNEIAESIAEEYDVAPEEARADLESFVAELLELGAAAKV